MTDQQRRTIEELFARYGPGVGSFVLARVGDRDAAEEITSRVFAIVVRKIGSCRHSPAGWLWAIVRTQLAQHFRRRRHTETSERLADPAEPPDVRAERREMQRRTRLALGRLPEDHQKLLYMKFYQDMRNVDIAQATGLSASNVGVLVHRSLKRLRALLEAEPARGVSQRLT